MKVEIMSIVLNIYTGCPRKSGTVDFQYLVSEKNYICLRH